MYTKSTAHASLFCKVCSSSGEGGYKKWRTPVCIFLGAHLTMVRLKEHHGHFTIGELQTAMEFFLTLLRRECLISLHAVYCHGYRLYHRAQLSPTHTQTLTRTRGYTRITPKKESAEVLYSSRVTLKWNLLRMGQPPHFQKIKKKKITKGCFPAWNNKIDCIARRKLRHFKKGPLYKHLFWDVLISTIHGGGCKKFERRAIIFGGWNSLDAFVARNKKEQKMENKKKRSDKTWTVKKKK